MTVVPCWLVVTYEHLECENNKQKRLLAVKLPEVKVCRMYLQKNNKALCMSSNHRELMGIHRISGCGSCSLLDASFSGFLYQHVSKLDEALRERRKELAAEYSRYGYLMLHGLLKAEGFVVNRKRTYRLYTANAHQGAEEAAAPHSPMEVSTLVDQSRSTDSITDQLSNSHRFRILNVVDEYPG